MSEPRKLHTNGASGRQGAAGSGLSDQDQYEAARRRAQQMANQNAQRRGLQQPVRMAQGRTIRQTPPPQTVQEPEPTPAEELTPPVQEPEAPRELTHAQRQAMAYRAAAERKYGNTVRFPAQRRTVNTASRQQVQRNAAIAREAEQRKNDLIVYLAHDLKTPLTSVIGYLTLLRDEPQISPEMRARYTGIALDKAERLEDLINEFFDITRFNLSHIELDRRPTDLTRMVEQVVSEFGPMLAEQRLTCRTDLPPRLEYSCDPDKMARVFDNLLRNACHYSTPGTEVQISGAETGASIVLSFHNEGRTIPPEKLERIFEQFFRLDSSRATRTGGAGLGLAIAKEIVELHGGTISARSWDNQVEFQVTLPKAGREGDFHG